MHSEEADDDEVVLVGETPAHPPGLPIFKSPKGINLIDGSYSLNITVESNMLEAYTDMATDETRYLFTTAELMQNIMDWVFSKASTQYSGTSQFVEGFLANFKTKITDDSVVILQKSSDIPVVFIKHVPGHGLVIVQNDIGMIDCLKMLTLTTTSKGKRRKLDTESGAGPSYETVNAGGYGVGLKQLILVCLHYGWDFQIHGTYENNENKISSIKPRIDRDSGLAIIDGTRDSMDGTTRMLFTQCTGYGPEFYSSHLMHVLNIPDVENFIPYVLQTHVSLKHFASAAVYRSDKFVVFGGVPSSSFFVNGIFAGKLSEEKDYAGVDIPKISDILVVGKMQDYTTYKRGQTDYSMRNKLLDDIVGDMLLNSTPAAIHSFMSSNTPFAEFIMDMSSSESKAAIKKVILESQSFEEFLAPLQVKGMIFLESSRETFEKLKSHGWLVGPTPPYLNVEGNKFLQWMTEHVMEYYNDQEVILYEGLPSVVGREDIEKSSFNATFNSPEKRGLLDPSSTLGIFRQFLIDLGKNVEIFRWNGVTTENYYNRYSNTGEFGEIKHIGIFSNVDIVSDAWEVINSILDDVDRVNFRLLFYMFKLHILRNGNVSFPNAAEIAANIVQVWPSGYY